MKKRKFEGFLWDHQRLSIFYKAAAGSAGRRTPGVG